MLRSKNMAVESSDGDRERSGFSRGLTAVAGGAVWAGVIVAGVALICHGQDWDLRVAWQQSRGELPPCGVSAREASTGDAALRQGASVDARSYGTGMTPLMWAAQDGNVGMIRRLLAAGADVSAVSDFGLTPLAMAASQGRVAAI